MDFPREEHSARMLFNMIPGMTPGRFQNILNKFGSGVEALHAPFSEWKVTEGFDQFLAQKAYPLLSEWLPRLGTEMKQLDQLHVRVVISEDSEFPEGLKTIPEPPIVLYINGQFQPKDNLAVSLVGTRWPTAYGRASAERLAKELSHAGVTLVSGLARGIDTVIHETALKNKGRTIGILGSGFKNFYPPENKPFLERMSRQGAVMTEFSLDTPPDAKNFPKRNRLVSGLGLAVVVVEASERSGALITARLAGEQGRDVFAVPGSVFSERSRGPHVLLKQGARLVEKAEDILDEIQVFRDLIGAQQASQESRQSVLSFQEKNLFDRISLDPVGMDHLAVEAGLSAASVSASLLLLELKGLIKALPGKNYVRTEKSIQMKTI